MLGIATISDPVQKPLLRDDLFDAEYSSSGDEADKPTQLLAHPQGSQLTAKVNMELGETATEIETKISEENGMDTNEVVERSNTANETNVSNEEQGSDVDEQDGSKKNENELESANDEQYNAEDGSDDEDGGKKFENGEDNEDEGSDDDGGGSDDEPLARPMPIERAKNKKQKAAERQKLTRKVKQQAIEQIHSESQRIIRESKLSIPYHKPKPLSLNEFFSKKPTLNKIKAPQAVSRILQCNRKDTPMPINRSKHSLYNRMRQLNGEMYKHTTRKQEKHLKKPETNCNEINSTDEDKLVLHLDSLSDDEDIETNLPEINFDKTNEVNKSDKNSNDGDKWMDVDKVDIDETTGDLLETVNERDLTPLKEENADDEKNRLLRAESQDWSLRLDTQTLQDTLMPVSDSEMDTDNALELSYTTVQKSELTTSQPVSEFTDKDSLVTPANKTLKLSESGGSSKKRLLERLKGYDTVIPKLGGDEGEVINLESNDATTSNTGGLFTLMERFVKHSTKKTHKRKSHVQLEVVKKEVNSEGKEELVHELVPVTLGEDEEKDPKLETPGAKLLKLKENLQVKMKAQREVERQRRIQAYKMDNEEGFEEEDEEKEDEIVFNEDEEADVTDGSEEDVDYIPDDAAEEDDDDDDEEDDDMEQKLKRNQFLDCEAEEHDELPSIEINNMRKSKVNQINEDNDSNDEVVFKIKKKKKMMVVDDDDDEDEKHDETLDNGFDLKLTNHHDTSSISSSSVKSLFKNPIRYSSFQDGRTMDLFDSSTNTTDPSGDIANSSTNISVTEGLDTLGGAFSFTPIKEKTGLIRHKSTDFANTPDDSDEDEKKQSKAVDSPTLPLACRMGLNSSFDNSSTITPYQKQTSTESDSNIPSNQLMAARNNIIGKMDELTLPIEDSQDLFQQDLSSYPQSSLSAELGGDTQNLHLSFEENTQTQFLDENGFLKVKSSKPHQPLISKDVDDDDDNASDMDELLGLCSGQFTATTQPKKGIFSQLGKHNTGTQDMDELLQLCSGTFTGKNKPKETDDDGSEASFRMLSDSESVKEKNDGFSDGDEQDEDNAEVDEVLLGPSDENQPQIKKMSKNNFVDEEAELSGSEFGSDEEYDAEEFGDLVVEEMLNDEVGNEDEIHNKIQKMHMKLTDDEDARRLRLYKEAFLTDGDLHDGTKGRTRQFRWRNVDDDTWASGEKKNSDDEAEDDENENEIEWRKQRHEREQCLKDQDNENKVQDEEDCLDLDENSQFDKFIKKISVKSRKKSTTVMAAPGTATHKSPRKPKKSWLKHGSFLNRAKNDLDRITNMFKPLSNPNGPRNARNFVFQSLSPEKVDETLVTSSQQMKRPLEKSTSNIQRNKKLKLSSSKPSKKAPSIFHHL